MLLKTNLTDVLRSLIFKSKYNIVVYITKGVFALYFTK